MNTQHTWIIRLGKAVLLGAGALAAVLLLTGCPPVEDPGDAPPAPQEEPVNPLQ